MTPRWLRDRWLPRNEGSWSPRRIIVLDAEGRTTERPDAEVDEMLLAVASFTIRNGDRDAAGRTEEETFRQPRELWRWVDRHAHHGHSTWLVTHGLHYDYAVTGAQQHLEALGWTRVDWSTRAGARWVRWRRGRRTLLMVDLFNYLHTSIEEIGKTIGLPKAGAGRPRDGSDRYWLRRCRRDVAIARTSLLRLLDRWDADDMGRWQLTSAGLAGAFFRHRHLKERSIRVHDVAEARALERSALFGGRREIFRKGELPEGLWVNLDYVSHYLMTAAEVNVPVRLLKVHDEVRPDLLEHLPKNMGVIARVEVELDEPVAPYRDPQRGILYRTGRFETTLCQPELELVAEHGRIVRWIQVATYFMAPALESWCEWLVSKMHGPGQETDELWRLVLKDWTRSLIGKFGQRRPERRPEPDADGMVWWPDRTITEQTIEHRLPWIEGAPPDPLRGEDAPNAVPSITAWIHSASRVTLWRAMETADLDDVAYCDTDGVLVRAHHENLDRLSILSPGIDPSAKSAHAAVPDAPKQRRRPTDKERRALRRPKIPEVPLARPVPGRMTVKGKYGSVEIHRPQDYVLDGAEVIKGVPKERETIGHREYRAVYWPGIPWQLANSKPGTFTRPIVEIHLDDTYDRGWVLSDGRVVPLEAEMKDGVTRTIPWRRSIYARSGLELADPEQATRIAARARSPGS